eukprot:SAG11_NODE_3901_length_2156_cov_7.851312_3_plen_152_part_00
MHDQAGCILKVYTPTHAEARKLRAVRQPRAGSGPPVLRKGRGAEAAGAGRAHEQGRQSFGRIRNDGPRPRAKNLNNSALPHPPASASETPPTPPPLCAPSALVDVAGARSVELEPPVVWAEAEQRRRAKHHRADDRPTPAPPRRGQASGGW